MTSPNPFITLLPNISKKPAMVPSDAFRGQNKTLDAEALRLFKKAGMTAEMLTSSIQADLKTSYDRFNIYSECARALEHWFVGPAVSLYANVATTYNPIHNATVWVTSENETYAKELNNLLDTIGLEEKIYDWAYSIASYGDLFVKLNGVPGLGVISIEDGLHPMNVSRVEWDGVLVGFYKTPQGNSQAVSQTQTNTLIPPWDYVHMRLLGAKRKRPKFPGDSSHTEMRQIHLVTGASTEQVTTRYGTSLILDALPAYKRLRLAEDSLLMARVTRGIIKYIWKCKVDMSNAESAGALIEQYADLITKARSVDNRANSLSFDSKQNTLTAIEDIFIPIWGDVGDLTFDKVGGEADIRWIVDVDNLRNQLAFALACSPSLGGAFTKEASGALGSEAISELGVRFARSARRLQRSIISGVERVCQIHLAHMGYDPDPSLFQVHMSETSSVEEAQIMKVLDSGLKAFDNFVKTMKRVVGRKLDMLKAWDYWNEKILKMEDFNIIDFLKSPEIIKQEEDLIKAQAAVAKAKEEAGAEEGGGSSPSKRSIGLRSRPESFNIDIGDPILEAMIEEAKKRSKDRLFRKRPVYNLDIKSYVPGSIQQEKLTESKKKEKIEEYKIKDKLVSEIKQGGRDGKVSDWITERDAYTWRDKFSEAKIKIVEAEDIDDEETEENNSGEEES